MAHILLDKSNRCTCYQNHTCVLGRSGSSPRCTKEELEKAGFPTFEIKELSKRQSLFTHNTLFTIKAIDYPTNI